jgi:pimeloyl-ACP methyl ester carboxylesterase
VWPFLATFLACLPDFDRLPVVRRYLANWMLRVVLARANFSPSLRAASSDANDLLYQLNASRNYDSSRSLDKITARVMWVNSADDFINPPELGIAEKQAKKLRDGRFVLIPISDRTHGHDTYSCAAFWNEVPSGVAGDLRN